MRFSYPQATHAPDLHGLVCLQPWWTAQSWDCLCLCQIMLPQLTAAAMVQAQRPYLLTAAAPCRHVSEGRGDTPALLWEGNEPGSDRTMTYSETLTEVCRLVGRP